MEQDNGDNLQDSYGKVSNYFTFSLIYNDKDTVKPEFEVISFTGNENLSFVYDFYITLRSTTDNIPALLGEVLLRPAILCIVVESHFAYYHGIVTEFRQIERVGDYTQYNLRLRAKTFLPYLNTRSDIYVGKKFSEIIDGVMKDNGFTLLDYELKLTGSHYDPLPVGYNRWSYVCQYEENDLDFLQRLMEREGVYYYFEQDQTWRESLQDVQQEKMVITDTKLSHPPAKKTLQYKPVGAPGPGPAPETIFTMIMHQAAFPAKVILRNYNYNTAGKGTMSATADVGPMTDVAGRVQTIYGENFSTEAEGKTLAGIRAEEIFCQTRVFYGMASGPGLTPGTLITISDLQSEMIFSGEYMIIHADHKGQQPLPGIEQKFQYYNTFTMIPKDVQFRPQRLTPKPKIHATMNAVIDGDLSEETPDIDTDLGRYKVRLPFAPDDTSNDVNAKWGKSTDAYHVRMATPYAGAENNTHGMNFPLHKGAEVVLSFRDGDPDLPIISGAVFNSQNFNVVTDNNPRQHKIKTQGGNQFVMDDDPGKESMSLKTPKGSQFVMDDDPEKKSMSLKTPKGSQIVMDDNQSKETLFLKTPGGNKIVMDDTPGNPEIRLESPGPFVTNVTEKKTLNWGKEFGLTVGGADSIYLGSTFSGMVGSATSAFVGAVADLTIAAKTAISLTSSLSANFGQSYDYKKVSGTISETESHFSTDAISFSAGADPAARELISAGTKIAGIAVAAAGALLALSAGEAARGPENESGQQGTFWSILGVGIVAEVAAIYLMLKKMHETAATLEKRTAANFKMDNEGIKMSVKKPLPPANPAEITMMAGQIKMEVSDNGQVIFYTGEKARLFISKAETKIFSPNGTRYISVTDNGIKMTLEGTTAADFKPKTLSLGEGNKTILLG